MIAADIKLDLTNGYDVTASKERDGKVRITISIGEIDLELWVKDDLLAKSCFQIRLRPKFTCRLSFLTTRGQRLSLIHQLEPGE
jgi:hypothetical protein